MNVGRYIFAQITDFIPRYEFDKIVAKYKGDFHAKEIAQIYRHRWDIEVFFKWIKQNITIKSLWGYSENAVKTHLWVAITAYLLLAKIKADTHSPYSITEVATLIRVSALEKT